MLDQLIVQPAIDLGIASVMARRGADVAAIGEILGAQMPIGPRAVFSGSRSIVGTGPGTWLVIDDGAAPNLAETLQDGLVGLASVSDQSSGYSVQQMSGIPARKLLQRGAAIDFHPSAFAPGSAATTVIAHIGVILWQVDEWPTFRVATFRSYADSFRHWLDQAAAAL